MNPVYETQRIFIIFIYQNGTEHVKREKYSNNRNSRYLGLSLPTANWPGSDTAYLHQISRQRTHVQTPSEDALF